MNKNPLNAVALLRMWDIKAPFVGVFLFVFAIANIIIYPVFAEKLQVLEGDPSVIEATTEPIKSEEETISDLTIDPETVPEEIQPEQVLSPEQISRLEDLKEMLDRGEITEEEYNKAKEETINEVKNSKIEYGPSITGTDPKNQILGKYLKPNISPLNGSLNYEYPIIVPPGRNGLSPDIKLYYNSGSDFKNSILGAGWSLNIPYIQRTNKGGSDKIYIENNFFSSLDGELVNKGNGVYVPRVENGSFLKYKYVNDYWIVFTKDGTKYVFGETENGRQDDEQDEDKIFTWMLEKITDPNGNTISYSYFKHLGQIYPDTISYNQDGFYSIKFYRSEREISTSSYLPGFRAVTAYRISSIKVMVDNITAIKYKISSSNNLIKSIKVEGYKENQSLELPPVSFKYPVDDGKTKWENGSSFNLPTDGNGRVLTLDFTSGNSYGNRFIDLNGDGLLDVLRWKSGYVNGYTSSDFTSGNQVFLNTGDGFTLASNFLLPTTSTGQVVTLEYTDPNGTFGNKIIDVNGDGLPDILRWSKGSPNGFGGLLAGNQIFLNTGKRFELAPNFLLPTQNGKVMVLDYNYFHYYGNSFKDVNGDGRPDIVRWMSGYGNGYTTSDLKSGNQIFINQKDDSGFVLDPNFLLPVSVHGKVLTLESSESMGTYGNKLEDLNGDGLLDILRWRSGKPNGYVSTPLDTDGNQVFLNTGYSFELDTEFLLPTDASGNVVVIEYKKGNLMGTDNLGNKIMDVNGDGLNDILRWRAGQPNGYSSVPFGNQVFLNTGRGFVLDPEYLLPTDGNGKVPTLEYDYGNFPSGTKVYGNLFKDVNGDSRIDIVRWTKGYPNGYTNSYGSNANQVFINTGHSFVLDSDFILPTDGSGMVLNINRNDGSSFGNLFEDINGDKIPDIVRWRAGQPNGYTSLSNGNEILSNMTGRQEIEEIINQNGGKDIFSYRRIRGFTEDEVGINRRLPEDYESFVVISHTTDDSNGNTDITFYEYKNAGYYFAVPFERKFTGFSETTETNPDGSTVTTKYHQNNGNSNDDSYAKIGKIYEKTTRDEDGNLYLRTYTKYEENDLGNNSTSILPKQELTQRYDGGDNSTDTGVEYEYDDYGNITKEINYGKVEGGSNGDFYDVESDKKIIEYIYDYDTTKYIIGNPKKQTLKDNTDTKKAETNFTYDSNGNTIMKTDWISGTSYAIRTYKYDNYGMLLSETNPLGKTTTYAYDTENLYPIKITNPLGHIIEYIYDYTFGKVKQITDPNGFVYQNVYDPLGRLIQEKTPSQIAPYVPVLKNEYIYTDTISNKNVKTLEYLDSKNNRETHEYFDGFGRVIQTRSEGEMSNDFNVKDIVYDNMGLVKKESLNYTNTGSARTNKTTTDHLYANYTYDTLGRILSISNSIGMTTTSYQGFKNTVTDSNGKVKNYYKDAYGNLVKVEEKNGTDTYTTNYEWNTLGKLTKITDALGNIRNFTYDQLGRRLTAEDLHAPLDLTFGVWTYAYDNLGNVIQTTLPDGKVVAYTYDALGRKTVEDYLGTAGEDIAYLYDCLNNIGKLCSSFTQTGTNTHYTYNSNGAVLSEKKIIDGVSYVNTYTYDIAGNITNIVYPDLGEVHYVYNLAGLLDRVERKESGGTFVNVISNLDYNPMGNIKTIVYPNLITTTNTYDDTKGYRLTRKLTQNNLLSKTQDLNYTYDNVGNTTKIVDASNTNTSKITNYTYDDLYRLLSSTVTNSANNQNYTETFTYNPIGNILTKNGNEIYTYGSIEGGEYANPHALTKVVAPNYSFNFLYDKNGNMIRKTSTTSAVLSGSVNGNGYNTYAWYESSATGSQKLQYGPLPLLPYTLNNLEANTDYQFRVVAQNEKGTTYGDWVNFTTLSSLKPIIFSATATPSTTSAKFKGSVSGSGESTYAWYESSKTGSQKLQYTKIENCTTPTMLPTYTLSGLIKDTSYKMRLVAQNKHGTTYGQWMNFRTTGALYPSKSPIINSSIATPNTPLSVFNSMKYNWSYKNELIGISGMANYNTYVYDSEGNRAKATTGGVSMYYPSKLYSRISASDKTKYIYANNILVATVRTIDSTITPYYIHTDHLGSTNAVSNSTGTVAELLDYYSYGNEKTSTGICDLRRKYIGEYCDNDTSLAYLNARYYNSYSGRFISIDPMFWSPEKFLMDPQQLNSYSYARNNPIVYRDPSGLFGVKSITNIPEGIFNGAVNTVKDLWNMVSNPMETITGLENFAVNTIQHPIDTYNFFSNQASNSWDNFSKSSDVDQGKMMGEGIFFVGSFFIGGGEASSASKLSKLSKLEKLSDATLVCRGGLCGSSEFLLGTGVKIGENGRASGISVLVGVNGESKAELLNKLPARFNGQGEFTTLGEIRNTESVLVQTGKNPLHYTWDVAVNDFWNLFNK